MIALPADHVVHGKAEVSKAVRAAVQAAATTGCLVTVGLRPTFPSTGLGYIHAPGRASHGTLRVRRFIEKPDAASARRFVREGGYFWNLPGFCGGPGGLLRGWGGTLPHAPPPFARAWAPA